MLLFPLYQVMHIHAGTVPQTSQGGRGYPQMTRGDPELRGL